MGKKMVKTSDRNINNKLSIISKPFLIVSVLTTNPLGL